MKHTASGFVFIAVFLVSGLLQAQDRGYIVWRRTNGREELRVPSNGERAPSVLLNGNFIATGAAADILSQRQAPPASPSADTGPVRLAQIMIYDDENSYLGAISQIGDGTFIAAAHVLDQLGENSLQILLRRLNIPLSSAEMYQFISSPRPLDAVLIINKDIASPVSALTALRTLAGGTENRSGDRFSLVHHTPMDGQLVEQQSSGTLSVSSDQNLLYLNNSTEARLTWGSSGALVFAQTSGRSEWHLSGVVQCVVRDEIASSRGGEDVTYFRALSARLLAMAQLEAVTIPQLKGRRSHYNLETCGPVDAKKGGGG